MFDISRLSSLVPPSHARTSDFDSRRADAAAALAAAIAAHTAAPTDVAVAALETAGASSAALPAVLAGISEKRAATGECMGD